MDEAVLEKGLGQTEATTRTLVDQNDLANARVRRKLDLHMMPLFFVLYMLAFLDRGNIGNAEVAGMGKALNLTSSQYAWFSTIFYITYIIFEFCIIFWKIFPPHLVGAIVVFGWGLLGTMQAAAQSWGGMMAIRFLLGAFEAAYAPGIMYLLSFFYLRNEVGFRCGLFASAAPLASTFAGALAYGITNGHSHLETWRLLFLVEGLATVIMSPLAFLLIPDSPDKARFLNAEEREIVKSRSMRQVGTEPAVRIGGLNLTEFLYILIDYKAWFVALMYFGANVSYASLPVYLPTILSAMGYSSINAQGLSAPPYFVAFLFALITTYIADRTQQRGLMLFATSIVGGIGYVVLATVTTVGVRYFAVFLASAGVFSTIPNIIAWTLNNQGSDTRRGAGLVLINVVGQCGSVLSSRIYPTSEGPRYIKGQSVCAAFMFFTAILAFTLRFLLAWDNKNLERKQREADETSTAAFENYGPSFRYAL
ncbi:major facilitator superfamily domain-containing protein [Talaromyces proteolyticus]|uniref:Major facilitator superfamily domain-containing protein n=1 Tax=Talaromyces proteolyticus TaxID=1131652 RepID=A0AAD4PX22_9EURO|nr:major facilitator superfamily domain-containing protein [Talaromyces proteolyticus]KAH8692159.1 major facilitator superfamily domain-containing protein [Talaromyces proteolyticus]